MVKGAAVQPGTHEVRASAQLTESDSVFMAMAGESVASAGNTCRREVTTCRCEVVSVWEGSHQRTNSEPHARSGRRRELCRGAMGWPHSPARTTARLRRRWLAVKKAARCSGCRSSHVKARAWTSTERRAGRWHDDSSPWDSSTRLSKRRRDPNCESKSSFLSTPVHIQHKA